MNLEERKYIGQECYVNLSSKTELVSYDGLIRIPLSVTEYKILSYFIDHENSPVYLEALAIYVWGVNYQADQKDPVSLKSHISHLRKKLDKIRDGLSKCLDTNHGLGSYTLIIRNQNDDHDPPRNSSFVEDHRAKSKNRDATPVQYQELLDMGYTPFSIAESLVKNDMKLYGPDFRGKGITPQNEGSSSQWAEYLSSVPETFQYLVDADGEIVGNFSFLSISSMQEEAYLNGDLFEQAFSPSNTRDLFSAGKEHIMFLLNLSVNDEYSTPKNNNKLRKMFLEELISLAENEVMFCKIITNVYKSSQEAFYKQWGFRFVKDHPLSGRVYELNLLPYPQALYDHLSKNSMLSDANEQLKNFYQDTD